MGARRRGRVPADGRPSFEVKDLVKLSDLTPAKRNVNRGNKRSRDLLSRSLELYGLGRPVLVDRAGESIAGSNTLEVGCRSAAEEIRLARNRRPGDPIYRPEELAGLEPEAT